MSHSQNPRPLALFSKMTALAAKWCRVVGRAFDIHVRGICSIEATMAAYPAPEADAEAHPPTSAETFQFRMALANSVPATIRHDDCERKFGEFVSHTDHRRFSDWWIANVHGPGDKVFELRFDGPLWSLPWEFLVRRVEKKDLERLAKTVVVRSLSASQSALPVMFDRPLRTLILKGARLRHPGDPHPLQLDQEVSGILAAWRDLPAHYQERVKEPSHVEAKYDTLVDSLKERDPNVLWFSGHGPPHGKAGVSLACGKHLTPKELADMILAAGVRPLFAVFWACSTGMPIAEEREIQTSPQLFQALADIGVLTILAQQTVITDDAARYFALGVFRELAEGKPLERAMAHLRADFLRAQPRNTYPDEWAVPVVWSAGRPVAHLNWSIGDEGAIATHILGWNVRPRSGADFHPFVPSIPTPEADRDRARAWTTNRRTIITGASSHEARHVWQQVLYAVGVETAYRPVWMWLSPRDSVAHGLREWARTLFIEYRLPGGLPRDIQEALSVMQSAPQHGLAALAKCEGLFLAVSGLPPRLEPRDEWLWDTLAEASCPVAVLREGGADSPGSWRVDSPLSAGDPAVIGPILRQAPTLAHVLAILGTPLPESLVSVDAPLEIARLQEWDPQLRATVRVGVGRLLTSAAEDILTTIECPLSPTELHGRCAELLRAPGVLPSRRIDELIVHHLLASGEWDEALTMVRSLLETDLTQFRPASALALIGRLSQYTEYFDESVRYVEAWAHFGMGNYDIASLLLERLAPQGDLRRAVNKEQMLAESCKNESQWSDAFRHLAEALGLCAQAGDAPWAAGERLACLHDRARLVHFHERRVDEAIVLYEQVIADLREMAENRRLLAIALRNHGEALSDRAKSATDPGAKTNDFDKSLAVLTEAADIAESLGAWGLKAETEYRLYRRSVAFGDAPESIAAWLGKSQATAIRAKYFLLQAIVEYRMFWSVGAGDAREFGDRRPQWKEVAQRLRLHQASSWAARVLIDHLLEFARLLQREDRQAAQVALKEALDILMQHTAFQSGTDRRRISQVYAGLCVLAADPAFTQEMWTKLSGNAQTWCQERSLSWPQGVFDHRE